MSVDLLLYSKRQDAVGRQELRRQLETDGWSVLFFPKWPDLEFAEDGPCGDGDLIVGCKSANDLSVMKETVLQGNVNAVENLLGDERFANCALEIVSPYDLSSEMNKDEIADLAEDIGAENVQAMQRAKSAYTVSIHAAQNESAGYLQENVWRALGKLCGGLMDNPQMGETFLVSGD